MYNATLIAFYGIITEIDWRTQLQLLKDEKHFLDMELIFKWVKSFLRNLTIRLLT